jgi:hypothetical protein
MITYCETLIAFFPIFSISFGESDEHFAFDALHNEVLNVIFYLAKIREDSLFQSIEDDRLPSLRSFKVPLVSRDPHNGP